MDKIDNKNSYSHILKYTGLFGGIQLLVILVGIVRNKFVAVILGPSGMGLVSLFQSTITLVSNSTNFGISMSAVRNISEAYECGDTERVKGEIMLVRSWSMIAALFGMIVCAVFSPLFDHFVFSWGDHTLHFVLLSPIVGMMAITGGELAILKATRLLNNLAAISVYNVIGTLVTSIPLYYFFGEAAIVPSLLIAALIQMLLTIYFSLKRFPLRFRFQKEELSKGMFMIKLGLAFVIAGVMGNGADFLIRSYLNNVASLSTVGFYSAGYMMTMVYAGMVFSAMETDYFPRLSAVGGDVERMNDIVNKQMEVSLLLVAPMMVCFIVVMPLLLPLLYSGKFMPALGMIQASAISIYFRAMYLPVEYIALAGGKSRRYLFVECVSDVLIILAVVAGFEQGGLLGAGIGMSVASVIEFLFVCVYFHKYSGYAPTASVIKYLLLQLAMGVLAYCATFLAYCSVEYWIIGALLVVLSLCLSVAILKQKTHLWNKLKEKFCR